MVDLESLISQLKDFKLRSHAKKEIIKLGPASAGHTLLHSLNDETPENVRWSIIDIFANWKWEGSKEALIDMLDCYPQLQLDLLRALKEITGLSLEADANLWRKTLSQPGVFVELQKLFTSEEALDFSIHDSYCSVVIPLPGSRRQQVLILDKGNFLNVYTECGEIREDQIKHVNEFNEKLSWAHLTVEKADTFKVTLTAEVSQDNISAESLKYSVKKLAELADSLEEQLTGKDKI